METIKALAKITDCKASKSGVKIGLSDFQLTPAQICSLAELIQGEKSVYLSITLAQGELPFEGDKADDDTTQPIFSEDGSEGTGPLPEPEEESEPDEEPAKKPRGRKKKDVSAD